MPGLTSPAQFTNPAHVAYLLECGRNRLTRKLAVCRRRGWSTEIVEAEIADYDRAIAELTAKTEGSNA